MLIPVILLIPVLIPVILLIPVLIPVILLIPVIRVVCSTCTMTGFERFPRTLPSLVWC